MPSENIESYMSRSSFLIYNLENQPDILMRKNRKTWDEKGKVMMIEAGLSLPHGLLCFSYISFAHN